MVSSASKVVVTGGAGFIGSHLVDRLLTDGAQRVVVLDNLQRGRLQHLERHAAERRLDFVLGDVRDSATVADVVRGAEVVFHLAAQPTVMGALDDLDYSFTTNVVGTFNVLRAASEWKVGRVVFASSREVYGDPVELPVSESQPLLASNAYGASKVTGEAYCRAFRRSSGLDCVILRLANVYGPRDVGRVIPIWLERAADGRDLEIFGGKQLIDFVWVGQVVESLVRAAVAPGPLPVINIGSGTGSRIVDVARRILRLYGGQSHIKLQPARAVEVTRFVADITRMRQILAVHPSDDPLAFLDGMVDPVLSSAGY
jgi:UDP-glucose 4-epimerase